MNIKYFEDIEVGESILNQYHTRLKKKRSSNSPAIGTHGIFILMKQRRCRPFLEDSLPVRLISFLFFRGSAHMERGAPPQWRHWVLTNFICGILSDQAIRSPVVLHTLKSASPGPKTTEES